MSLPRLEPLLEGHPHLLPVPRPGDQRVELVAAHSGLGEEAPLELEEAYGRGQDDGRRLMLSWSVKKMKIKSASP